MRMASNFTSLLLASTALFLTADLGAEEQNSGFLDDYSKLKPVAGTSARMYTAPGAYAAYRAATAIMIDQPEIVIAGDSKYRGIKPDEAKAVADSMRQAMSKEVSKTLPVVDRAGPNVLLVRLAASNIHLNKKKRGVLGYTPIGFVVTTATQATQSMQQKIILQEMNLEIEILESQSLNVLSAMVDKIEPAAKKPGESWAGEQEIMNYWADRLNCWLSNARKPEGQRAKCTVEK